MPQYTVRTLSQFSTAEVRTLFDTGRLAFKNSGMTVLYAPRTKEYGRILVVTSRKVGSAPARNLIRRRLKALFYEEGWFNLPYDFIFIIRTPATQYTFQRLKALCTKFMASLTKPNSSVAKQ
jgi:ribonuclease P protein component